MWSAGMLSPPTEVRGLQDDRCDCQFSLGQHIDPKPPTRHIHIPKEPAAILVETWPD